MKLRMNPPLLYQASIVLMVVLHFVFPVARVIDFPYNLIGIVFFVAGAALAIHAKRLFRNTGTPIKPSERPKAIHRTGVYAVTRNPMYLGIFVGLFGIALFLGSLITFFFPILFLAIMNFVYVPHEEKMLLDVFSTEYLDYKKQVPRWLLF